MIVPPGVLLFLGLWSAMVLSLGLALVELVGMWRYRRWSYRLGVKVLEEAFPLTALPATIPTDASGRTDHVRFRHVGPGELVFRAPIGWSDLRVRTPLAYKGRILLGDYRARVEVRLAFFPMIFLVAWTLCVLVWGVLALAGDRPVAAALAAFFAGPVFGGGMALVSWRIERRRGLEAIEELRRHFGAGAPAARS